MQNNTHKNEIEDNDLLNFQLDLVKTEISQIHEIIGRIDTLTQQVKNWTILVWAGSISLLIGNSDIQLRKLILFTAIIPSLFWIVDGYYRRRQRGFIFRMEKISHYLNSKDLIDSFKEKSIKNFIFLDLSGKQTSMEQRFKFANLRKAMWFKSIRTFYLGLISFTIVLQIVLYPKIELKNKSKMSIQSTQDSLIIENQNIILNNIKVITLKVDSLSKNK